jgi:hypothetical protein
MKIFNLLYSTLIGVGFCAAVSSSAQASDVLYYGGLCTPVLSDINKINRSPLYGVYNVSSSVAQVQCPFSTSFSAFNVNDVWVTVYDRNPTTNVNCSLYGVGPNGILQWQTSRSSSGSEAGAQSIQLTPPSGGKLIGTMNMACSIPSNNSAGLSFVNTYRLIATP